MTTTSFKKSLTPWWCAGATILVVGVAFFGWQTWGRGHPRLPVDTYVSSARGLAGNRYELQGRIERQLETRAGVGRIILARDTVSGRPVPFLDAGKSLNFNPEPGQLYALTVQVALDGLLELTEARKL